MTAINKTNQAPKPPIQLFQGGPIKALPNEVVGCILFHTKDSTSTSLVNHNWNVLSFSAAKESNKYDLKHAILLITEALDPVTHAGCIAGLNEIQIAHQSLTESITTFKQIKRLFLTSKGLVIRVLRKLPELERFKLKEATDKELPDSMKDIFEISELSLLKACSRSNSFINIRTGLLGRLQTRTSFHQHKFFTLLQSYESLSIDDRGRVALSALDEYNIDFFKVLLADGPISEYHRGLAVHKAAIENYSELVKFILAYGLISEHKRGHVVYVVMYNNNPELVKLLLANGPISENCREDVVEWATKKNHLEIHQLLYTPLEAICAEISHLFQNISLLWNK